MKLTFCGGAAEVGASCYLLEIDGRRILLDSGIRMKGSDNLPDFSLVQNQGGVEAIVVSHAHLDHTGSLPVISREYPAARIYMSRATKDLTRVLLYDSLKIMEREEADIPIYAEKHVREMMERIICYSPQFAFRPFRKNNIRITFYNGGHIAGSSLIYIQGEEGTLLYTGDFSGSDQRTVNGASIPRLRPDLMIMESTYGDKLHSNREIEEKRLLETVEKVIKDGGKMLIPAFALGRAQELILILKKAINRGTLPEFKIYIDGMVRAINRVYRLNPNYLKKGLAKKIFRGIDIFYDDNVIEIEDQEKREEIIEAEGPLCVISSSGMLKGGPSSLYAEKFADNKDNFIAITGYQDEEAPGRDVLDLLDAEEDEKRIQINNKNININCGVGKYGLSAHADKGELQGIVHRVSPRRLFLVHGEKAVIENLALELNQDIWSKIQVPENGEIYEVKLDNPRKQINYKKSPPPLKRKEDLTEANLKQLWDYIFDYSGKDTGYTMEELIYIWSGKKDIEDKQCQKLQALLTETPYFTPNNRRLFLYHPAGEDELKTEKYMEMNELFVYIDNLFPEAAGLYKRGARIEEKVVLLNFNFPLFAVSEYQDLIEKIPEETGWQVEINENCNKEAAEELIYFLLPADVLNQVEAISFYRDKNLFRVSLNSQIKGRENIEQEFKKRTGLQLLFEEPGGKTEIESDKVNSLKEVNEEEMMEQNQALAYIERVFAEEKDKIYKKSIKKAGDIPYLEITFITPVIGLKYSHILDKLEEDTGWNVVIGSNPVQNEIIKLVRLFCRQANLVLSGNPGIYQKEQKIKIKINGKLAEDLLDNLRQKVDEEIGYKLEIS